MAGAELQQAAKAEGVSPDALRRRVAEGKAVLLSRRGNALAIGAGVRTKVNCNIGASPERASVATELRKARAAVSAGTDTLMDLSVGRDAERVLRAVLRSAAVPVGTVPVYAIAADGMVRATEDDLLNAVARHIKLGADFVTVHAAITKKSAQLAKGRLLRIVSRGGCFLALWMEHNTAENPFYRNFDYVLELCKAGDTVLSIGDALRPGCLADANDKAQMHELVTQARLVKRCRSAGVQAICEGPGHMRLDRIAQNVALQKKLCAGAPYYVLGPLATDIGAGHDHVSAAIGGAIAAAAGADFLCVVTPSEHVALPNESDVREGVIAARIAAHAGDVAKGIGATRDSAMSRARAALDWQKQFALALDGATAKRYWGRAPTRTGACSMCGEYCAIKLAKRL
jgi:phosphomethylpyrimidine synthase